MGLKQSTDEISRMEDLYGVSVCNDGDARLADGRTLYEGRVEVCWNGTHGQWASVCDDKWTEQNAKVICRQLGFSGLKALSVPAAKLCGQGTGAILDEMECTGLEENLLECSHIRDGSNCKHSEDVAVRCFMRICEDGEIRLSAAGDIDMTVEICYYERWWSMCGEPTAWTINEANVVCSTRGYQSVGMEYIGIINTHQASCIPNSSHGAVPISLSGTPPSPILLNLSCSGSEKTAAECDITLCDNIQSAVYYAGVSCQKNICNEGAVSIEPFSSSVQWGRVLVCKDGEWKAVCTDGWSDDDASVVCGQLGFPRDFAAADEVEEEYVSHHTAYISGLQCTGSESVVLECAHSSDVVCSSGYAAVVNCHKRPCEDGDIRLEGSTNALEGRIGICQRSIWGSVCSDTFTDNEAKVACRQLGYSRFGARPMSTSRLPLGRGPTVLYNPECSDHNDRLVDCPSSRQKLYTCSRMNGVGVKCQQKVCEDDELRLVDGIEDYEGRVEICNNEQWYSICDTGWSDTMARLACNQLGLNLTNARATTGSFHGDSKTGPLVGALTCPDSATLLSECRAEAIPACDYYQTAGIIYGCGELTAPSNGNIKYNQRFGSLAIYTCNEGYAKMNDENRICQEDGSWSGVAPTCEAIACGPVNQIDNGYFSLIGTGYDSEVIYYCNAGYTLVGPAASSCNDDGLWSNPAPTCEGCGPVNEIDNGQYVSSIWSGYYSEVMYFCNAGYTLVGPATSSCTDDGLWSNPAPTCEGCGPVNEIDNGYFSLIGTGYDSEVIYYCNAGYALVGPAASSCTDDGLWSNPAPTCEGCGPVNELENGYFRLIGTGYGSEVIYFCNAGYTLVGEQNTTCNDDGLWRDPAPECIYIIEPPRDCEPLEDPKNGRVVESIDEGRGNQVATYICDEGFTLNGEENRFCQAEEHYWSGVEPTCEESRVELDRERSDRDETI